MTQPHNGAILESLCAMLLWLVPFVAGNRLKWGGSSAHPSRWLSAAAGIAISYVFVDLLPEMNHMQAIFSAATVGKGFPLPEFRVYFAALVGFVLFYALQNMVMTSHLHQEGDKESPFAYRTDIGGYVGYCGLMSYFLALDARNSRVALLLYSGAMFFHFWLVDHSMRREHPEPYDRVGKWLIASGIVTGWVIGAMDFSSDELVPTLMGFIGGGVVMNSLREELPEKGEGRLLPFIAGAFGYAVLLMLIKLAEKYSHAAPTPH